jgi:hypothetical protein
MRRRIQSGGAAARAGNVPGANAAPAAGGAAAAVPRPQAIQEAIPAVPNPIRANETAVRPPVITKMPDPATLPCVSLLGVVKVPVALRGGFTAATLDAKLGRGARFGVRCSSHEAMCKYVSERMKDTGAHFGLLNLLNTTGEQYAARGCTPKYVEVLPMMRPGEPEPRERVSVRVLVVDSASAIPKRPRDVAVEVAVSDTVGTLVETIRETCAVSRDETVLLTNVAFKPNTALNKDASSYGECRVSHVYTTRNDSFRTRPARGVKGFARAFPPESGYAFKHTDRGLGVGRFEPDRSKTRDVLVAYVLPKETKQLAVVNPTYHFDFKAFAADAKKQTEAEAAFDERRANASSSSSDDEDDYYGYGTGRLHDVYCRRRLAIQHTLGTLGIPVVVPANAPEINSQNQSSSTKKWSVGGGAQAEDLATRVKRVLEACVPAAAVAAAGATAAKGKRRAVAGVENLPVPFLMHTEEAYTQAPHFRLDSTALEDVRSRRKDAPEQNARWSFAEQPRSLFTRDLANGPWASSGYQAHGVTAVFDLASMTEAARTAVKRDSNLLPGGAEKLPSAVADDAALPELYRRQSLEDIARARSLRIVEELMRASMSFHIEVKPLDWARNYAARHPSRLRWKPWQPLARTATSVRAGADGNVSRATLEIAVYVKNESFAKPADANEALRLFEGPHAWTCRSLLDVHSGCRLGDASNTLGHIGGRHQGWSHWYSDPSLHTHGFVGAKATRCTRRSRRCFGTTACASSTTSPSARV